LGLVLDEPSKEDQVFDQEGITYLIDTALYEKVKPIKVDFITTPRGSGLFITSNLSSDSKKECGSCSC
jgi:Fe-S cluster assembly iron-binding protein IscA